MQLTRRDLGAIAAGAAVMAALPRLALASESNGFEQAIMDFTGGVEPAEGDVTLGTPEIAENGNTVPIEVSAPGAAAIMVLSTGNPNPGIVTFEFSELSGERTGSTRIRLAKTQDLIAVAKMEDGSFTMAKRQVKVTIGGCGG
ncbi:MAG: thiosulfate oxidation carrier protein SoxY [Paracoccaceae bacterium]|nr:thiosulfate oxidation carrier protein SoxY [Paracoccaceae bacterium]